MPQLIGLAVLGAAVYFGYRMLKREMARVGAELDERTGMKDKAEQIPTLVKDPETGVYRPKDRT